MYIKLKDRKPILGFAVVNTERTKQMKVPTDYTPHGIIIDEGRGFLLDQWGNLWIADCYDNLIPVDDNKYHAVEGRSAD